MAELDTSKEQPKLELPPKADTVDKEAKTLTSLSGGFSPELQDIIGQSGKARSTKDIMGLRSRAFGEQMKAQQQEGQMASQAPVEQAQAKGEFAQKESQAYQQVDNERQRKMAAVQIPDFKPTQDNLMTLATIASLTAVVGAVVGGQGGLSGLSAIQSMTGMMKGYQAGRKDVFDREKVQFQNDMARLKAEQEKLMKEFEAAYKRIPYDLAGARADMEVTIAKSNSKLLKATYDKQGAEAVLKLLDANAKDVQHLENMAMKVNLASAKAGKTLKDKEINSIVGMESLAQSLDKLKADFKPEYASLGAFFGIGADLEFEAMRRLGTEEGRKAVKWWSQYSRLQAPNRHELFGATLTGNELKNYQEFTAKKSDSSDTILDQLEGQINYSLGTANQRRRSYESSGYRLPEAPPPDFLSTYQKSAAPPPAAGGGGGGYQVGQIIDQGGKRYQVTKIYPDDPSNPEVKEVK
jgi:outer membrane protein OmpA-like peptidoglycan-associated protein